MCDTKLTEFWLKACENRKIPLEIAKRWLQTIQTKYNTEPHRFYHNVNILEKKCDFLFSLGASVPIYSDYLIFAIFFQYFQFDLKSESGDDNCKAFQEFYNATGVNDVSPLSFINNIECVPENIQTFFLG